MSNELRLANDCATEPIQIPGSIQPHGLLIALRSSDFTILQVSQNVFDHLGIDANELLHQPLSRIMDVAPIREAVKRLTERTPRLLNPIPMRLTINGREKDFDGILHRAGRIVVLELETHIAYENGIGFGFGSFYESIRDVASKFFLTEDLPELLDVATDEIRKITNFDRVMIYKFDADWNGTVISESRAPHVSSFLNHHFPASDIPRQARELYTVNWLRLIPDVDYKSSPMVPTINPITDKPLDMTNAVLRSVSPIHVEYMKNMDLGASMSISILKNRKLWGLISCHHLSPHYLRYDVRVACEFIGQTLSSQVQTREQLTEYDHKLQLKSIYTHLLSEGGLHGDLTVALQKNVVSLLALTDAQGAIVSLRGEPVLLGRTPTLDQAKALLRWTQEHSDPYLSSSHLSASYPAAREFADKAAGILAVKISNVQNGQIIWLRPEQTNDVVWSGNPNDAKRWSESDLKYHPRKSFEAWTESVAGRSNEWGQPEIDVALEFRTAAEGLMGVVQAATRVPFGLAQTRSNPDTSHEQRDLMANRTTEFESKLHAKASALTAASSFELIDGFTDLALALLDKKGHIKSWSAGARRLFGYSLKEVVGKSFAFLLPEAEALKDTGSMLTSRADTQGSVSEEIWVYRKDGTSFWAKISLNKTDSSLVSQGSYSMIIQDITKEKAAEEELTAAKVSSEAANRTKSAFLANISHEIRTPLGAVLGFAELMNAPNQTDDERHELYERVQRNGQQLSTLINDLLDMSKAEAGRFEVELIDFDFMTLVNDIEQTFLPQARAKIIQLDFEVAKDLPRALKTDPTRVRQIFINLLSNAVKFTATGFVRVSISRHLDHLEIRVKDSGRGMSVDERERLFKPFTQADASMTRKYGGTGLGLVVSQRLARALGGDLVIEKSELGEGTTFLATIDISKPAQQPVAGRHEARPVVRKTPLLGLRVLLVDDSPDNRELISIFLRGAGAEVTTAENGKIGVELALTLDLDVVLMDIQMPVMDGQEAMRTLSECGFTVPVVALTAHAMKEEREQSLALGFSGYLTKPVNRAELNATLEVFRR